MASHVSPTVPDIQISGDMTSDQWTHLAPVLAGSRSPGQMQAYNGILHFDNCYSEILICYGCIHKLGVDKKILQQLYNVFITFNRKVRGTT